jgi:hypothetical protein
MVSLVSDGAVAARLSGHSPVEWGVMVRKVEELDDAEVQIGQSICGGLGCAGASNGDRK